jgi:hypothetical protein
MTLPHQALFAEMQAMELSMEELLRKNATPKLNSDFEQPPLKLFSLFPGLRLRIYNSFLSAQRTHFTRHA